MERVRVNARGAARWRRRGHPWIYRSDVLAAPDASGGVVVEDEAGSVVGTALYSASSQIAVRMLTSELVEPGAAFWRERIDSAIALRDSQAPDATAWRLVHGEADGLPSLIVDRYADFLSVQLLSAGLEVYRNEIVDALVERTEPAGIVARNDVPVRTYERLPRGVELLHGQVPETVEVREGRVRWLAAPWSGQKTGAFLDQRENRQRAGELARGRALDAFSYHGSFALHLATHCEEVVAVDASADALVRAEANAALNGITNIRLVEANAFDFLRAQEEEKGRYDVIVLDPPAFAKTRASIASALRGYKELNLRALKLLAPGGHLCTFSCSYHVDQERFRAMLESAAADSGRPVRWIEWRGPAPDHPQILQIPETSYLKGAILQAV